MLSQKSKKFIKDNWTLILALIYVVSPIDFIPEAFLPFVGATDDVVVIALELWRRYRGAKS